MVAFNITADSVPDDAPITKAAIAAAVIPDTPVTSMQDAQARISSPFRGVVNAMVGLEREVARQQRRITELEKALGNLTGGFGRQQ